MDTAQAMATVSELSIGITHLHYTAVHSRTHMTDKDYRVSLFKEKAFQRMRRTKCYTRFWPLSERMTCNYEIPIQRLMKQDA
jgi:hypothetical protein